MNTDLRGSLLRAAQLQSRAEIRVELPDDPNWVSCADLLSKAQGFDRWRQRLGDWLERHFDAAPSRTTAGYVMSWYLHVPAYLGALLMHHERRVPLLRPSELGFRLCTDRPHPDGMALLGNEFYCLPSDPGSGLPEATVVADEPALAALLRTRFIAHAALFINVFAPRVPLGRRMLWAAATDALDNSFWWIGKQGETPEAEGRGVADAALVLPHRCAPLTAGSTLRTVADASGHRSWARRRESCCFSYLLPNEAECAECPRTQAKKP